MVTGSNYLLEYNNERILIDCGLHQGSRFCERHNWEPFVYDPASISAVFVTHSHIDHIGRLPKLVKDGFQGTVYSTLPARDFSEFLLRDSDHILAKEAEDFKLPILFTEGDVDALMSKWQGIEYHKPIEVGPFKVVFHNAGHILGSSFISVEAGGELIVFSGDLGNAPAPLIGPWEFFPGKPTYCVVEATYGDRIHEPISERQEVLENVIEDTVKKGGTLLIPAFAMERTQELLFELNDLVEHGRIPKVPVFLDSPLAIRMTAIYKKHERYFTHETKELIKSGDEIMNFPGLKMTLKTEESKAINAVPPPKVIIAGSGMSHGGRILHHERRYLSDPKSTFLIIGYQAQGSLGRQIFEGARSVKIFGEEVPVNCRIQAIGSYSAHADQKQLLEWLRPMRFTLKKSFVVQGEEGPSAALAQKIIDELAVKAEIPRLGEEVVL